MTATDQSMRAMFRGEYAGKKVFVTGHTGFKGSWLCEWLLQLGAEVTGFSLQSPTQPALFDQLGLAPRLRHHIGDIRDRAALGRALAEAKPDFLFHLAAQPLVRDSYARPVETFEVNLMGTVNLLEALRTVAQSCAAVFITTDKCYENREWVYGYREEDAMGGHDPYSASKGTAELAINSYRRSFFQGHPVRVASARAGNVIGGGDWALDRIVPDCMRALDQNQVIGVRNPRATRPWQHVLEPVGGYLWLGASLSAECGRRVSPKSGVQHPHGQPSIINAPPSTSTLASAFNFGPGHESNRTVEELVREILKHWPGKWEDRSDPKAVHEATLLQLSTDKANALLGWAPVWDFPMSIEQTVRWYRAVAQGGVNFQPGKLTREQIAAYTDHAIQARQSWTMTAPVL